uniref:RRM domain-containing protein n=1 Tax=Auxenochlorella protothecoides TaxID=3075 RepID=A0A1D2A027_AUXPR
MTEPADPEVETMYDDAPETSEPAKEPASGAAEEPSAAPTAAQPDEGDPLSLPPHGADVFVGGVPRTATSDQIRDWASKIGEVHSVTLVPDVTDPTQNRGYGFVVFTTRDSATAALAQLHSTELPDHPGFKVRVQPSQSKHRLFLGGLPNSLTQAELRAVLEPALRGLEGVELMMSRENPESNRGFAFLDMYNAAAAKAARAVLSAPDFRVGGRGVTVDFAEPSARGPGADRGAAAKPAPSRNVFVGGLPAGAGEDALREAFARFGAVDRVHVPRPRDGEPASKFGFVTFAEREAATAAVEAGDEVEVAGEHVTVRYGRSEPGSARGRGRGGGGGRYGAAGYADMGMGAGQGGMVPLVPVQLADGQIGYMMQPGAFMGGNMMMMGGGGGGYYTTQQGAWGGGGGGPQRGDGGGARGGRGQSRYRPY